MRATAAVALTTILVIAGALAPGASLAGSPPVLKWSDVAALVDQHPAMGTSQASVEKAQAGLSGAKEAPNPTIGAGVGYGDPQDGSAGSVVWDLELTVPLEWMAQRKDLVQKSGKEIEAAGFQHEALRLEVLGELRRMFVRVAYDMELIEALAAAEQNLEELSATIELQVEAGDERRVQLARVKIEAQKVRLRKKKALAKADAHKAQLRLWLGQKLPEDFEVQLDLGEPGEISDLQSSMESVGSDHPLVMAASLQIQAAHWGVKAQKHGAVPQMAIGGFVDKELDAMNYGGLISVSLPLWNFNKSGVDEAQATQLQAESELQLVVTTLQSRVIAAHAQAELMAEAADLYEDEILREAEQALEDVRMAYGEGDAALMDLIDAQRTLVGIRIEYLDVLLELNLATTELRTLTGGIES